MSFPLAFATAMLCASVAFGQVTVKGSVTDGDASEPLIGASIVVKGTMAGTTSDLDGNFTIKTSTKLPFILVFSAVGMETKEVEITKDGQEVKVTLAAEAVDFGQEVVISASRVEERLMEAPVTVEKLDAIAIRQSSTADYYDELSKLKGVHTNSGSLTFTSVNTRGFATNANTRFVQLMDGMDNAAPLLNFPTGNIVGIGELDIANVELLPGAASALYGPNAFNGILLMNSLSPFDRQGLSAQVKAGAVIGSGDSNTPYGEGAGSTRYPGAYKPNFNSFTPLYNVSVRYAKALNDKFAFKVNASHMQTNDWAANDYTTDRNYDANNPFGNRTRIGTQNFDGMHTYGDEFIVPAAGGITRTGWREEDILDNRLATSTKADASIHFRPNDKVEFIASYRYGTGNSVYQGSERYALRDFSQQFSKLEAKGKHWFARAYMSQTNDGNSYNMTALGSYMNEKLFPTATYLTASDPSLSSFSAQLRGALPSVLPNLPSGWATAYNFAFGDPTNSANDGIAQGIHGALNNGNPLSADVAARHAWARQFADNGGINQPGIDPAATDFFINGLAGSLETRIPGLNANPQDAAIYRTLAEHMFNYRNGGAIFPVSARPAAGSNEFTKLRDGIKNGLFQRGGAGFVDNSRLWHAEANYDFSHITGKVFDVLVGANVRRYDLATQGTVFNEDPDSTGIFNRITIDEFGTFVQIQKRLFADRLKLTGSLRFDKNQNFEGRFTPRISVVYTAGEQRQHNFRASFQTGFRNPTTQDQFIYFPTTTTLLGGTPANAARYNVYDTPVVTEAEWNRLRALGVSNATLTNLATNQYPTTLSYAGGASVTNVQYVKMNYIKPEQLIAYEIGYKGILGKKMMVDINAYYNQYTNFMTQTNVRNLIAASHRNNLVGLAGDGFTTFRAYTNDQSDIQSWGSSIGVNYKLPKDFAVNANYTFTDFQYQTSAENFEPGFNTPRHRFGVGLENRNSLIKNFGFGLNYRWQDSFLWQSSFATGYIKSYGVFDMQVNYTIKSMKTIVKAGVTNLFGPEYQTNYGGPFVGRMLFVGLTYDQFMR